MARISKSGIANGGTIDASHITRIIEALDGTGSADIYATGSFTGSFIGNGSGLTNVTASSATTASFAATASFLNGTIASASFASTASRAVSASFATTASYVKNAQTASLAVNALNATTSSYAQSIDNLSPYTSISYGTATTTGSQIVSLGQLASGFEPVIVGTPPTTYLIESSVAAAFVGSGDNAYGATLQAVYAKQSGALYKIGATTKVTSSDFASHFPNCDFKLTVTNLGGGTFSHSLTLHVTGSTATTGSWVATTRITQITGESTIA